MEMNKNNCSHVIENTFFQTGNTVLTVSIYSLAAPFSAFYDSAFIDRFYSWTFHISFVCLEINSEYLLAAVSRLKVGMQ